MGSHPFQQIETTFQADAQVAENGLREREAFTIGKMFLAEQVAFGCLGVGAMMESRSASDFGQCPLKEDGVVLVIFH